MRLQPKWLSRIEEVPIRYVDDTVDKTRFCDYAFWLFQLSNLIILFWVSLILKRSGNYILSFITLAFVLLFEFTLMFDICQRLARKRRKQKQLSESESEDSFHSNESIFVI